MSNFSRQKHNPMDIIKMFWPDAEVGHITYDPTMKCGNCDYKIIRGSTHDSTLLFTHENMQNVLLPVLNMQSCHKKDEGADWKNVKGIRYVIGDIRHASVFGMVRLPCSDTHDYPGMKERVTLPVRAELVRLTPKPISGA